MGLGNNTIATRFLAVTGLGALGFAGAAGCTNEAPELRLIASDSAYVLAEQLAVGFGAERAERLAVSWARPDVAAQRVCDGEAEGALVARRAAGHWPCALVETRIAVDHLAAMGTSKSLITLGRSELRELLSKRPQRFSHVHGRLPDVPIQIVVMGDRGTLKRFGQAIGTEPKELREVGVTFVSSMAARSALKAPGHRVLLAPASFVTQSNLTGFVVESCAPLLAQPERNALELVALHRPNALGPWLSWISRYGDPVVERLGYTAVRPDYRELRTAIDRR